MELAEMQLLTNNSNDKRNVTKNLSQVTINNNKQKQKQKPSINEERE